MDVYIEGQPSWSVLRVPIACQYPGGACHQTAPSPPSWARNSSMEWILNFPSTDNIARLLCRQRETIHSHPQRRSRRDHYTARRGFWCRLEQSKPANERHAIIHIHRNHRRQTALSCESQCVRMESRTTWWAKKTSWFGISEELLVRQSQVLLDL